MMDNQRPRKYEIKKLVSETKWDTVYDIVSQGEIMTKGELARIVLASMPFPPEMACQIAAHVWAELVWPDVPDYGQPAREWVVAVWQPAIFGGPDDAFMSSGNTGPRPLAGGHWD